MIDDVASYTLFESVASCGWTAKHHSTPAKAQRVINHNYAF